jgi:nitrate reductase assembly molybdenum cofactor insertion protein NarJ
LPQKRRLMSHPLTGSQRDRIECNGGVSYEVDFSLDTVEATAFYDFQKQLTGVQSENSLVHAFDSSGRCGLGAVSYIHVESRERSLAIKAFHTFPDDYAIVRSQSVFRLPQAR